RPRVAQEAVVCHPAPQDTTRLVEPHWETMVFVRGWMKPVTLLERAPIVRRLFGNTPLLPSVIIGLPTQDGWGRLDAVNGLASSLGSGFVSSFTDLRGNEAGCGHSDEDLKIPYHLWSLRS